MKWKKILTAAVLAGLILTCAALLYWKTRMPQEALGAGKMRVTLVNEKTGNSEAVSSDYQEGWLFTSADAYADWCRENGKEEYPSFGKRYFKTNILVLWRGRLLGAGDLRDLQAVFRREGNEGILELAELYEALYDDHDCSPESYNEEYPLTAVFTELPRTALKGAELLEVTALTDLRNRNNLYAEEPLQTKHVQKLFADYQKNVYSGRQEGWQMSVKCTKAPSAGEKPVMLVSTDKPEAEAGREAWGIDVQPEGALFKTSVLMDLVLPEDFKTTQAASVFFRRAGNVLTVELMPFSAVFPSRDEKGAGNGTSFPIRIPRILLTEAETLQVLIYGTEGDEPFCLTHTFCSEESGN